MSSLFEKSFKSGVILKSEPVDAEILIKSVRGPDFDEIVASMGTDNKDAIVQFLKLGITTSSQCWSVFAKDASLCFIFGIHHESETAGRIWALGTNHLKKVVKEFIQFSPKFIDLFHQKYDLLYNIVDERNTLHISWLKRLGFTFLKTYKLNNFKFIEFCRLCVSP